MQPISEFYKNIPAKQCIKCGDHFEEQYESYALDCMRCINKDVEEYYVGYTKIENHTKTN